MWMPDPVLASADAPPRTVPMKLPVIDASVAPDRLIPCESFPEMTLVLTVTPDTPAMDTPAPPLPWSVVPAVSVPIKLCSMSWLPAVSSTTPFPPKRLIASPRRWLPAAAIFRPSVLEPALVPSSSIRIVPALAPAWLNPSMNTGLAIVGSADAGWMGVRPAPADAEVDDAAQI